MGRWEHQRDSTLLASLLLLIVSPSCDADNSNVSQVMSKSIPTVPKLKLQEMFVWYASYGSNMNMQRFLCYIEGGKTGGMRMPCEGSRDKTRPTRTKWESVPYRMFFGLNRTKVWGPGGVAFLDLQKHKKEKAYIRLYKITLQQFDDVLKQENDRHVMTSPLFTLNDLRSIRFKGHKFFAALKKGWYPTVVYLGQLEKLAVLTFTCAPSKMDDFRSNKLPICPPSKGYRDVIIKALVEERNMSLQSASAYIRNSYEKPLKGSNSHSLCCSHCDH